MEDKSPLITVKTEIKEEILEDESIETDRLGVHEEHNYNKNQLHHSMNIKEESDYYTEIENSYSSEIAENETVSDVQTQENILMATNYCDNKQIKAEKYAVNLKTLEKDKAMGTETFGSSATLLTEQNQFINIIKKEVPTKSSRKQQKLKKEDFDYELAELHHSINIKEEVEFMETENIVLEDDYNLDTVRPFLDSQYYPTMNNQHSRNNTRESKSSMMFKIVRRGKTRIPLSMKRKSMRNRCKNIRKVFIERQLQRLREMFLLDMIVDHEEEAVEHEYYHDEIRESKISNSNTRAQKNEARWGQNVEDIANAMKTPKDNRMVPRSTVHGLNSRRRAFEAFCQARKVEITEATPMKEIARVLKDYAFNMRRQDGSDYKESTLKTHWNSTARDLQNRFYQEYGIKFDAFKDVEFAEARNARDSKRKILQSIPEKRWESSTAFTMKEHRQMVKAYDESTPEGLSHKFFLVASKELEWCTNEAVRALTDYFVEEVKSDGSLTGSLRYHPDFSHSKRIVKDKWLTPNANDEMCPVRLYKKMLSKRPKGAPNRVFLNANPHWRLNKSRWYVKSPVGKNTLGTWTKEAAERIGVKGKKFAKHSRKSTVVTNLTDSKIPEVQRLKTTENHMDNDGNGHQTLTGSSRSGNVEPQVREEALRNVNLQRNVNIQQYINSVDPPPLVYIKI